MTAFAADGKIAEKIDELPPSAKLVFKVLEYNGQMTQTELADETRLSTRTVRYALNRLQEKGLITKVPCLDDGRRTLYDLDTGEPDEQSDQEPGLVPDDRVSSDAD